MSHLIGVQVCSLDVSPLTIVDCPTLSGDRVFHVACDAVGGRGGLMLERFEVISDLPHERTHEIEQLIRQLLVPLYGVGSRIVVRLKFSHESIGLWCFEFDQVDKHDMAVFFSNFRDCCFKLFLINNRVHIIPNLHTQVEFLLETELVLYTPPQFRQIMAG